MNMRKKDLYGWNFLENRLKKKQRAFFQTMLSSLSGKLASKYEILYSCVLSRKRTNLSFLEQQMYARWVCKWENASKNCYRTFFFLFGWMSFFPSVHFDPRAIRASVCSAPRVRTLCLTRVRLFCLIHARPYHQEYHNHVSTRYPLETSSSTLFSDALVPLTSVPSRPLMVNLPECFIFIFLGRTKEGFSSRARHYLPLPYSNV